MIWRHVLPRHRQQTLFERFVRGDAVKTILLEAKALAGAGRTLLHEKNPLPETQPPSVWRSTFRISTAAPKIGDYGNGILENL